MTKKLVVVGEAEEGAIKQGENCLVDAEAMLLMADTHQGYGMPVGGVAVYRDKISPAGVGFDISCGNAAVKTDVHYQDLKPYISSFADLIWDELSFGIGRKNEEEVDHSLFDSPVWKLAPYKGDKRIKSVAQDQLGTIGSGNHYVDVFYDEDGMVWVGVHFGSRGLGHKTASYYMNEAGDNVNIMDETPHTIDTNSQLGQDYIAAMQLCGEYAYAGRDWVCEKVVSLLGCNIVDYVHNHHNYAWKEEHFGDMYWVVRKGATPAFPGQRGFIGGSMMDNAVIVQGVDSPDSENLYYSTVHGAGRVMSRTQARGKTKRMAVWACGNRDCNNTEEWFNLKPNETKPVCGVCGTKMHKARIPVSVSEGLVDFNAVKEEMAQHNIQLRGAGADEAPQVYKRLEDVLAYHAGTIEVLHTLTPVIVCMAGSDEFDPYKD